MARRRKKASAVESEVLMTDETLETESSKSETEGSTESLAADFGDETTGTLDGGEDLFPASSDTEGTGPAVAVEAVVEPTVVAAPEVKVEAKPKKTKKKEVFGRAEAKPVEAFSAPSKFTSAHEKQVSGKTVQINSAWTS